MSHELTKVWQVDVDGKKKWEVRPSVGKDKGKTLKTFDNESEAEAYSHKRSREYKPKMAKRDYKDEYNKFQKDKSGYRAKLNKFNRKKGTYGNRDGLDASHKGGKIKGFETEKKNRGRREKSRKKGFLEKQGLYND